MTDEKKHPAGDKTHFGYQTVKTEEKVHKVATVFNEVAGKYDLMNDLMSAGLHRVWKREAVSALDVHPGQTILDLAGGTGDLTALIAKKIAGQGRIILADINYAMLHSGRDRMINANLLNNVDYVITDAQQLSFPKNSFDRIIIGFGLRNVTNVRQALAEMLNVLTPGGKLVILEFSKLQIGLLKPGYEFYSFNVLPFLGKLITGHSEHYRYLAESIRMHPDQLSLQKMMEEVGFGRCSYQNLCGGIVAIHTGYKF